MIDITKEKLITFEQAAEFCDVSWKTVYCWSKRTARPLESVKLGGLRRTSIEAIQRFLQQGGDATPIGAVLPTGPKTDYDEAVRGLQEHGTY